MCLYPKIIQNKKYVPNKKNGGIVPAVYDKRVLAVPIGCGICMECKKKKAREWSIRLQEEIKTNKNGKFVTLTFSNESIKELTNEIKGLEGYNLDNEIATKATRRFLERWRKKYKKSLKHWFVTELGKEGTENIHIHGIVWTNETKETISEIWKYGYTRIFDKTNGGWVNEQTINYIVKYANKVDEKHPNYNQKILTSPGIGKNYTNTHNSTLNKFAITNTKETYTTRQGHKISLPIYYRNKIYNEEEREKLWIQKLDKNVRYIGGEKIEANNWTEIQKLQDYYRKINKKLGYGDNKTWKTKEYEEQRRKYNLEQRIAKASTTRDSN